jgi:site-specific DNA-methyltransferase (adenine-specific)
MHILKERKRMELNKIYNEDCLIGLKKLENESVDGIVTDPPFMISQAGNKLSRRAGRKSLKDNMDVKLDFGEWDQFENEAAFKKFTEAWFAECVRILKPGCWFYIFFDKQKTGYFDLLYAKKYGMRSRTIFTWLKSNPTPSFRLVNWLSSSEFVWVGSKGDCRLKNFLKQTEMFNYMITPNSGSYGETEHPTEKPKVLIKRFIETSSNPGEIILDPFMGSATTAVCAYELNRKFIGFEKNKEYYDMGMARLHHVMGQRGLFDYGIE